MGYTIERRHVTDPAELDDPEFRRVFAYYMAKAAGRSCPERADIDPLDIAYALANLILLDVREGPPFSYRVVGTKVVDRIGRELTGKTTAEIPDPEARAAIEEHIAALMRDRRPVLASSPNFSMAGRTMSFESLHLPLDIDGKVGMILMVSHQTFIKSPAWKMLVPR